MKYNEFENEIKTVYAAKFPKSLCTCEPIKGFDKRKNHTCRFKKTLLVHI